MYSVREVKKITNENMSWGSQGLGLHRLKDLMFIRNIFVHCSVLVKFYCLMFNGTVLSLMQMHNPGFVEFLKLKF